MAGPIAMRYWRQAPEAWEKAGDAGPVSEADLAVDLALRQHLTGARPDYGWLSEESPDSPERLSRDRLFIVDPIDGTRAYLAGEEAFALSLSVVERGRVTAAVVHLPARQETYSAAAGGPARKNGAVLQASARQSLAGAEVLTTKANLAPESWPKGLPEVRRKFRSSLAWRLCLAAEGKADAMLTLRPTWEWDIAAGALIAEAAGCTVTDRRGRALPFNQPDPRSDGIIAAPAALHAEFMAGLGLT